MWKLGSIVCASFALIAVSALAHTASRAPAPDAEIIGARTIDIDGGLHHLGMEPDLRPVTLVFLDTGCPISNRYTPRLNELARVAAERGIDFFGVLSDPNLSSAEARTHRDEYELAFPILFDASGDLAARLSPTHVPEAFVVSGADRVLYRGRIDDRFEAVGTLRKNIASHDLLDAIEAASASADPAPRSTPPIGCVFEAWDAERPAGSITYNRDVAPILNANCVDCHRTGDIGPFPLQAYGDVRRRARMIAQVCQQRRMPPWFAEPDAGSFRDERLLSRHEIATLKAWAAAGAPEGDPADLLPAPPLSTDRWRLGEPDLIVEMPVDYELPASGDDIYRYFVIPSKLTEDQAIVGVDFRPGDPSVVHHCIVYMDRSGTARRIDDKSSAPGFSVFGEQADSGGERFEPSGLDTSQQIAGWAPGTAPQMLPPGLGSHLGAGGDFVLEIHYHLTGKATTDRSALALYFAKEPVERYTEGMVIGTQNININPGDPEYRRHVWMEVPTDLEIIDVSPHMHYLGKEVEVVATLPDGTEEPLIRIDDWDFRWQGAYVYRKPIHLPQGSRIDAYFRFDNSEENPFNPSAPPIRVREGWRTTDEMCLFYFTVVPREPEGLKQLYQSMFASFGRSGSPD